MGNPDLEETLNLSIDFAKQDGLVPVVVQDVSTRRVLMVAYTNEKALQKTCQTGIATFYSRKRQVLWVKDSLRVTDVRVDCDQDALLYLVENIGENHCHTKDSRPSCFYRRINANDTLSHL
ncbi:MAG: phosphoribosyl-AMP cyclohydrolase [Nanoarchaeota archaeon]